MTYTAASLKAELNERGWRLTPQREEILRVFQNLPAGEHLSAEDLYNHLLSRNSPISLSTIYRTLKELNQPLKHHHHLICVSCSKTIEFKSDSVLKIGAKTSEKEGYHLLDCQLTIHGVCPTCQRSLV
nr:Fur repressor protein [Synechococcus elongatus PCC 7942 = FACHB-805]